MADKKSIFEINIKADKAVAAMSQLENELEMLKKAQKDIEQGSYKSAKQLQASNEQYAENAAKIKVLNAEMDAYRKQLTNQVREQRENDGSLKSMRATLSNLRKEYDELSADDRGGKRGKDLEIEIMKVNDALTKAEEATGRFQRNVGNYYGKVKQALEETMGSFSAWGQSGSAAFSGVAEKMAQAQADAERTGQKFEGMSGKLKATAVGLKSIGTMAVSAGKSLLSLAANPFFIAIAAVVGVLVAVANAMRNSEERADALAKAAAPLTFILDAISNGLSILANGLVKVVTGISNAVAWLMDLIGVTNGAKKSIEDYNKEINEEISIGIARRKQKVDDAKMDLQIAKLRDKESTTDRKNFAERRKLMMQAINLEKQKAANELALATREYNLAKAEADRADNDKAANEKLTDAEAKLYQVRTANLQKLKELNAQVSGFDDQIRAERENRAKADAEKEKKRAEENKKIREKEISERRAAIDLQIANMKDGFEKERRETNENFDRQIADLKRRLKTETDLTIAARRAMNNQIVQLEQARRQALDKIADEEWAAQLKRESDLAQMRLDAMDKDDANYLSAKIDALHKQEEAEIASAERTGTEVRLIRAKYAKMESDERQRINAEKRQKQETEIDASNRLEIAQMRNRGESEQAILQREAEQMFDNWASMQQRTDETATQFAARSAQMYADATTKQREADTASLDITHQKTDAMSQLASSVSAATAAIAEGTDADETAKKAMAGLSIVTSAAALAQTIEKASKAKTWYEAIAEVAASVAAFVPIISNIKTLAGYASGGYVSGAGSGTSDSINARLSNGEYVVKASAVNSSTLPVLNAMNGTQTGANVGNQNFLAQQMVLAMSAMPAPIVSVQDINKGQNRVNVIETSAKMF